MQSAAKHLARFVAMLPLTSAREMLRSALHDGQWYSTTTVWCDGYLQPDGVNMGAFTSTVLLNTPYRIVKSSFRIQPVVFTFSQLMNVAKTAASDESLSVILSPRMQKARRRWVRSGES